MGKATHKTGFTFDHIFATQQGRAVAVAREVGEVRPLRDKAVGFVMEAANGDTRHGRYLTLLFSTPPLL